MAEHSQDLPDGYHSRAGTMDDVLDAVQLMNKTSRHFIGVDEMSPELLSNEWKTPGFDPQSNVHLVISPRGQLVGEIEVWDITQSPVHPWSWMAVDPECRDKGAVHGYLLAWGETRARQLLQELEPDLRVSLRFWTHHENEDLQGLLERGGFSFLRHSMRMRYDIDGPPPQPSWPKGISVRDYDPERDAEAVYRVDDEVFQDHFGYIEEPFEEGFQRFMHHMTGHEAYDPSLWFLAVEGDEIVGICLCRKWTYEDRDAGYISSLGVRRPWRRKGIATALLHHAFDEFYQRGKSKVDLGVDAENLTGALDLYRKAGMYVYRQYDMYEKELRPGKEISVTGLDC